MSPALRNLVELLAELTLDDHLREYEQNKSQLQREPNGSNAEEARADLDEKSKKPKRRINHPKS